MRPTLRKCMALAIVIALSIPVLLSCICHSPASGATALDEEERLEIALEYAPALQYVKGESCYPVDVDYYLESCWL